MSQVVDDPQVHCALGPNDKGCLARDLNVAVYFDDYEPNLSAVRDRAGARCYLVDASYNRHVTVWPRVKTDPAQWKAALGLDISRRTADADQSMQIVYESGVQWDPERPDTLIITCVDGRWYRHFQEFARVHLAAGERTDYVAVPGGIEPMTLCGPRAKGFQFLPSPDHQRD